MSASTRGASCSPSPGRLLAKGEQAGPQGAAPRRRVGRVLLAHLLLAEGEQPYSLRASSPTRLAPVLLAGGEQPSPRAGARLV